VLSNPACAIDREATTGVVFGFWTAKKVAYVGLKTVATHVEAKRVPSDKLEARLAEGGIDVVTVNGAVCPRGRSQLRNVHVHCTCN
jgi:hypothetical protein